MVILKKIRYMHAAWLIVIFFGVLRLFYSDLFLLSPDETNYWQWSRHLAWGYHDQAPMIAWTIHLSTLLLGHKEFAVRLPSVLSLTIASLYLVQMARQWFNERISLQTALISQSIFLFNVGALLATADGLQAVAWAGATYHTALALKDNHWRQWLSGGAWFGFGMLSKYTMVLFLPCIFFYALLSSMHRPKLMTVKPWAACALGLAMFTPVIVWNAQHDWNSVRHVAYIGGANQGFTIHIKYLGDYIASQAALLTPMVFILICVAWFKVIRRQFPGKEWIYTYLFYTSFPVVGGFAFLSLHSRVYGNWPGFGYVTAILLATALLAYQRDQERNPRPTKLWKWSLGSAYLLTFLVLFHVILPFLPIPVHLDRTKGELQGWDQLGRAAKKVQDDMPDPSRTFLFGPRYQVSSELAFYVPGQPETVSINRWNRPNVYDYWWQDRDLLGMDAVGVFSADNRRKRLLEVFQRVDMPEKVKVYSRSIFSNPTKDEKPLNEWYLYRCYGFKGGLRWVPPDASDVRAISK